MTCGTMTSGTMPYRTLTSGTMTPRTTKCGTMNFGTVTLGTMTRGTIHRCIKKGYLLLVFQSDFELHILHLIVSLHILLAGPA
jgi:hypothetical protein